MILRDFMEHKNFSRYHFIEDNNEKSLITLLCKDIYDISNRVTIDINGYDKIALFELFNSKNWNDFNLFIEILSNCRVISNNNIKI